MLSVSEIMYKLSQCLPLALIALTVLDYFVSSLALKNPQTNTVELMDDNGFLVNVLCYVSMFLNTLYRVLMRLMHLSSAAILIWAAKFVVNRFNDMESAFQLCFQSLADNQIKLVRQSEQFQECLDSIINRLASFGDISSNNNVKTVLDHIRVLETKIQMLNIGQERWNQVLGVSSAENQTGARFRSAVAADLSCRSQASSAASPVPPPLPPRPGHPSPLSLIQAPDSFFGAGGPNCDSNCYGTRRPIQYRHTPQQYNLQAPLQSPVSAVQSQKTFKHDSTPPGKDLYVKNRFGEFNLRTKYGRDSWLKAINSNCLGEKGNVHQTKPGALTSKRSNDLKQAKQAVSDPKRSQEVAFEFVGKDNLGTTDKRLVAKQYVNMTNNSNSNSNSNINSNGTADSPENSKDGSLDSDDVMIIVGDYKGQNAGAEAKENREPLGHRIGKGDNGKGDGDQEQIPLTREELLERYKEAIEKKYRRIFVPNRGWFSIKRLQEEIFAAADTHEHALEQSLEQSLEH